MNILLCGASGFIGQHIMQALTLAGHRVLAGRSQAPANNDGGSVAVNFNEDTNAAVWLPRLQGIDAVINAVGVLRDSKQRPIQAIHADTPMALLDACAQAGVRRVIHISALGIEGSQTRYAQTKLAADTHLLRLNEQGQLDGVILRPSIVFGKQGDSSRLFMALSQSPVLLMPRPVIQAKVQPLAVQDLAQAVARLLNEAANVKGIVPCVGPEALTLSAFIASLRAQQGKSPARILPLPDIMTMWSARVGDQIPGLPWCSESLAMLAQDNTAPPALFSAVLGRASAASGALLRTSWT